MNLNSDSFLETLSGVGSVYHNDPDKGDRLVETLIDAIVNRRNKFIERTGDLNDLILKLNERDFEGAASLYIEYMERQNESRK